MSGRRRAQCRSCSEPVEWVETVNGKKMPLDYDPPDAGVGNIQVDDDGIAHYLNAKEIAGLKDYQRAELRTSHFATCPNAAEHRKGR